jgi:hypothetical protein
MPLDRTGGCRGHPFHHTDRTALGGGCGECEYVWTTRKSARKGAKTRSSSSAFSHTSEAIPLSRRKFFEELAFWYVVECGPS